MRFTSVLAMLVDSRALMNKLLVALCSVLIACDPKDYAAVVVAPQPAVRMDSSARAEFSRSAIALLDRVSKRHGLQPYVDNDPESTWSECLHLEALNVCGGPRDSLIEFRFWEWARFSPLANALQHEVAESLRAEFGGPWVRECALRRRRLTCPTLALPLPK